MSVSQSNTSNLSLPSLLPSTSDTKDRLSHTNSETVNISTKQIAKIVLLTIVSVSLIVIGSMYLKQCPVGAYIPVYLLVTGLMGLLKALLSLSTGVPSDPSDQTVLRQALMANSSKSSSLINCFLLCWFVIGSYWIYNIYEPNYGRDCNKTLYLFAFWMVTSVYLAVAVVLVTVFLIFFIKACAFCMAKWKSKSTEVPANV